MYVDVGSGSGSNTPKSRTPISRSLAHGHQAQERDLSVASGKLPLACSDKEDISATSLRSAELRSLGTI